MELVYIEWEDAIAQAGWHSKRETRKWAKESSMIISQIGWVYKETKKYIVLISRICIDDEKITSYGNLQKIPKTWIKKRINLSRHIK